MPERSPSGAPDQASSPPLTEQAVKAFAALQRRADREVSPDRLRSFLQEKRTSPETIFDALSDFGRAQGLMAGTRLAGHNDLLDKQLEDDLVLLPGDNIGLVEKVDLGKKRLTIRNFGVPANSSREEEREVHDPERLVAAHNGRVAVLHLQGRVPRFLSEDGDEKGASSPLHVDNSHGAGDPHDHHDNIKETFEALLRFVSDERKDLIVVTMYAVMVAVFNLSIPLASQGIIDAVSTGTFTNQIVVLCGAVVLGLLLYGAFNMLQYYTVDMVQRRLFAATGLEMAYRLPLMKREALEGEYGPPLINRFFDVITMQKSLSKLLLDGLGYILVAIISLILLCFYDPFFLVIGLLALLFAPILVWGLGRNGIKTGVRESSAKYAMAHWLEDLARCQQSFKLSGDATYVHNRADRIASEYVRARSQHFRVFIRQVGAAAVFRAFIVGIALGIGGYLTVQGQITLGQFVAAELVIASLTSAGFNLVELFESGYDLIVAVSKILHVTEKPLESVGGEAPPGRTGPASFKLHDVSVGYNGTAVLDGISLDVGAGTDICVVGASGSGKSTLARTLMGLHPLKHGRLLFDGHDMARLDMRAYRRQVGIAPSSDELFRGTIEENITMGRSFEYDALDQATEIACLKEDLLELPKGLRTVIASAGLELPKGLARRIMIARAIIGEPRLLILDEAFDGIKDSVRQELVQRIYGHDAWTTLSVVDDEAVPVRNADRVVVLERGRMTWSGQPEAIWQNTDGFPEKDFPQLVASLRTLSPA